jgi:cyclophilin family peptidyl-prolyl cis-trans isomerase
MQTDLGALDILLMDTVAQNTVTNFLQYVNDGDYDYTFLHRSATYLDPAEVLYPVGTPFVVQGGGYIMTGPSGSFFNPANVPHIPEDAPIANEFLLSNLRGTMAMARFPGNPDSATSEWFFNMQDNSVTLDTTDGGFAVFAQVQGGDVLPFICVTRHLSNEFLYNDNVLL